MEESGIMIALRRLLPTLVILNVIFLPLAMFSVLQRTIGPRQFVGFFLVATFCLSYYFTYIRKYQVNSFEIDGIADPLCLGGFGRPFSSSSSPQ
jgi:hypothetical protein